MYVRPEVLRLHLKLVDGVERYVQPHVLSLLLVVNRRGIHSVKRQIVVIQTVAGKANGPLISGSVVDRAGNKPRQGRPVAAINRKFVDLFLFDWCANSSIHLVKLHKWFGDTYLLRRPRHVQTCV